ncbi:MAG: Ig-like domain-containing protein [Reichenbachiella sp.]
MIRKMRKMGWVFLIIIGASQTQKISAQAIKVDVNLNVKHTVGGISEFDRKKFITVHSDQTEADWTSGNGTLNLAEDFLIDMDVYMGRNTGGISWNLSRMNEDPEREGFANPADVAGFGATTKSNYEQNDFFNTYENRNDLILAAQLHPFYPDGDLINDSWSFSQEDTPDNPFGFATGEFMGRYVQEYHGGVGQPLPKWIEVINEPMWHLWDQEMAHEPEEIFKFHNGAAAGIRSIIGSDIPIGGFCTAFPDFEKNDFEQWNNRWKLFMDMSGENMDFWTIHLYDWPSIHGGKKLYRKGSNIEATFDMMEHYSLISQGEVKPMMISEYGAMAHDYLDDFWTPYRDWLQLKSISSMMMTFMDRPNLINISMPFIVLKAEWGRDQETGAPYNHRLMRKANEVEGETGEHYVYTEMVKFYQLWSDVNGTRVDTKSLDLDIQVDAYIDGDSAYVILNNLYFEDKTISVNLFEEVGVGLDHLTVKHLYLQGQNPVLETTELTEAPSEFTLGAEGTMILTYAFDSDITIDQTSDESKYYALEHLQEIGSSDLTYNINGVTTTADFGEATLRLGIGRDHGKSLRPQITFNGQSLTVPKNYSGDDQNQRDSFFGVLEVPVPFDLLEASNIIEVSFIDEGGHVSSATLRVFEHSQEITRTPGDPVTGVSVSPEAITLALDMNVQLVETLEPVTAENFEVSWSSSDDAIASVDQNGFVTAHTIGVATITVTTEEGGFEAETEVTVVEFLDDGVSCELLPSTSIDSESTYNFQIPYTASDNRTIVIDVRKRDSDTWGGGAEVNVAAGQGTVDMLAVMTVPLVPGDEARLAVYIKPVGADWTAQTDACQVYPLVSGKIDIEGLEIVAENDSLDVGESMNLTVTTTPSDATVQDVIWTVDNASVATISSNGRLTAVTPGDVNVTATSSDNESIFSSLKFVSVDTTTIEPPLHSTVDRLQSEVRMYPNPANQSIQFSELGSGSYELLLYDLSGQLHKQQTIWNEEDVIISDLAPGIYIAKLTNGIEVHQMKLMKD